MVVIIIRAAICGLALSVSLGCARTSLAQQQQPAGPGVVPMSSDEKVAMESAVRSDPRIRALVGTGQPRFITTEVEPDKKEAEDFLAGRSQKPPTRRVIVIASNAQTNKAARVTVAMPQNKILAVQNVPLAQILLVRDDAEEALALAKSNPELRRVVGETLERYTLLEPGSDERVRLPLRCSRLRVEAGRIHASSIAASR